MAKLIKALFRTSRSFSAERRWSNGLEHLRASRSSGDVMVGEGEPIFLPLVRQRSSSSTDESSTKNAAKTFYTLTIPDNPHL